MKALYILGKILLLLGRLPHEQRTATLRQAGTLLEATGHGKVFASGLDR